jgi:glycerol kinase
MLLGIDEGTTGVKAALFDQRLQPAAEARRDKVNRHPEEGWVEQDGEEVIAAVTEAIAELLERRDDVVACGLDHQGESVLAWDSETGEALSPIVVWQDKRSQEILNDLTEHEKEVQELSGLPFDPYFSAAKLAWLLRHNDDVKKARDRGRLRMGTVDSFLCDRLGAGFATEPATASRTQLQRIDKPGSFDERLCEIFGVPIEVLPEIRDTAGELGTLRHASWPVELPLRGQVVDQQAALAGAACIEPGRVKATYGTGVFVLAHVGEDLPEPAGGLLPTVAWRIGGKVEYALDGGVFAAGAMLEWMTAQLGVAENPPALSALARSAESSGGVRVLPGLAGIGAPWWRPNARAVIAGISGGTTREQVARGALEGIAWRVADVVAAIRETAPVDTLRVDGGLTNEPLLLQLQADSIGAPVEAAGADATVLGAAALAGVGQGLIELSDLPGLLPPDRRVEPERDESWREAEHERWREFVRATEALDSR